MTQLWLQQGVVINIYAAEEEDFGLPALLYQKRTRPNRNRFRPKRLFEERPIGLWTESDVLQWWDHESKGPQIPSLHRERYRPFLKANHVDGATLMQLDGTLWLLFGVDESHVPRILDAVKALCVPSSENSEKGKEKENEREEEKEKEKEHEEENEREKENEENEKEKENKENEREKEEEAEESFVRLQLKRLQEEEEAKENRYDGNMIDRNKENGKVSNEREAPIPALFTLKKAKIGASPKRTWHN